SAKQVLEVAIVLLGLTLNVPLLLSAGPWLAAGIIVAVFAALLFGVLIGRAFGLRHRLAILVAVGNAICGNSAIAAVAPVIGAEPDDVASSIAFTAVLGVTVVLALPLLVTPLGLSEYQYGVVAGLTVYAVPQVLAATLPVSALSGQVGTLVKLTRVLMLGPIVIGLSIAMRQRESRAAGLGSTAGDTDSSTKDWRMSDARATDLRTTDAPAADTGVRRATARPRIDIGRLVPWFIVGFVVLAAVRATGVLPPAIVTSARTVSGVLTIVAMAALGLGVDVRVLRRVGAPVTATAIAALALLLGISIALARTLHVG
ncbi:MAG: putative sulfate exporter family transporter, partial [Gemmatimonadaceae bacterium]